MISAVESVSRLVTRSVPWTYNDQERRYRHNGVLRHCAKRERDVYRQREAIHAWTRKERERDRARDKKHKMRQKTAQTAHVPHSQSCETDKLHVQSPL